MPSQLSFGEEKPDFSECKRGDWVATSAEGPGSNMVFRNLDGPEVWEFALVLHSDPAGEQWVWKRVS